GKPFVRAFGSVLALSEAIRRTPSQPVESAGKANMRKTDTVSRNGPSVAHAIKAEEDNTGRAYPGRLHVYDVATGKRSLIVTNQADSEILLVDKETIYYRVNDSLYTAKLGESGPVQGKPIATDDRIRDAHWAFMK